MSKAFKRGQLLEEKDLVIKIRDSKAILFDPYQINYSIYDDTGTTPLLLNNHSSRVPVKKDVGIFYAVYPIPHNANFGQWRIVWHIQELESSSILDFEQCFNIVTADSFVPINKNEFVSRIEDILDITITDPSGC